MQRLRSPAPVLAIAVCVLGAGCSSGHHSAAPTRPQVNATGPIISASPSKPGVARTSSDEDGGAEGASTEAGAPCPLASAASISASFGARIANEVLSTAAHGEQLCRFSLASSNLGPGITLNLSRTSPASAATFHAAKQAALSQGAESISGVGTDAYYSPKAYNLQYLSGSTTGAVQVQSTSPATLAAEAGRVRANLVALAKAAIANQ